MRRKLIERQALIISIMEAPLIRMEYKVIVNSNRKNISYLLKGGKIRKKPDTIPIKYS
jgi:hypothetical protein